MYNFNECVERKNTNSLKYDFAEVRNKPEDILPFWVADMDFKTSNEIVDAITKASQHGIFGYSESHVDYFEVVKSWMMEHFQWDVESQWLVKTPGVVYAIATAIKALTKENDGVLIQEPVYYPFRESVLTNNRNLVINELVYESGKYSIDFKDFEEKIQKNNVKLFILCSPHNPVGRVWSKEELKTLGDICLKYNVLVVSDEIHADLVRENHQHFVFSKIKEEYAKISITCTSPSKTFNIAGLQISNIFIQNEQIRELFQQEIGRTGYSQLNTMGIVACKAAYQSGHVWLKELKSYIEGNISYAKDFVEKNFEGVNFIEPEGTYLVWLDFKEYIKNHNLSDEALDNLIVNKAKLWLDPGNMFGSGGAGFQRINIACPRGLLEKGFTQLKEALFESITI